MSREIPEILRSLETLKEELESLGCQVKIDVELREKGPETRRETR